MSLECVNVMNKQELGSNSSKTVEHGHDACDSHKSSPDREEGEVEDGEIDDDDERKIDDSSGSPNIFDKISKRKNPDEGDSDNENHGSKRHKDRKRRHKKEKRHHHVSHKRRHQSPETPSAATKNDGSPLSKKSRRSEEDHRGKHYDYDRPPSGEEDFGTYGLSGNRGGNRSSSYNPRLHNGSRRRSARSGSSPRPDDRDDRGSPGSFSQGSEGQGRMQDLFSDGDDLDLDVAAYERDGAFQRNVARPERQQPKTKKKKNKAKLKEYWSGKPRREDEAPPPRRWDTERKRCRFYMEGRCGKADHCPFSHDFKPPKKQELCKFYAISSCLKGEYCVYMHGDFPCKFYHTGNRSCKFEKDCKFSHDPLTLETQMVLDRFLEERDSNNNGEDDEGRDDCPPPFNIHDEERIDRIEEKPEIPDDRKNSLLGSPPSHYKDRNRNRMAPRESPGLCESLPERVGPQGTTPGPNFGPRQSPGSGSGMGPPGGAMSPPQNVPSSGVQPSPMPPLQRPFGFQTIPESAGMSGPMGLRPQLGALRQMVPMASGPLQSVAGSGPPMLLTGRGVPPFGARLPAMRPPANMVPPPPQNALPAPGMNFAAPRPVRPAVSNPQLDNLASMLVQAAKQQGKKPEEETEQTSMLKAAGADDSDLEEEGDSLDAMVHRMRKDAEEQQRQKSLQGPQGPQGFQAIPRPSMTLLPDGPHLRGTHPHGPNHGPPHPYGPPHGPNPQPFPPRAPGYSPQLAGPPPAFVPPPEEKAAQQLYLRIAKQTANGMQEQLAREQKAEAAETPASPPPPQETETETRAWKLIPLDVPLKTPYPLMQLPHDLPYSRADPRLTGQLRLSGGAKPESQPQQQQQQQQHQTQEPQVPHSHPHPHPLPQQTHSQELPSQRLPHSQQHQQQSPTVQPHQPVADVGGRPYTPSMPQTIVAPKDPRLGRAVPEVPAALLQKPLAALPLDLEPPDRPPPKMQLSERSSSFQSAAPAQPESRAYLLDPRFRRRKASLPSTATPDNPDEPKKDSTPVPSSGESSPV